MYREWKWWWRAGKVRKSLHLRLVARFNRWENPWRMLLRWARGGFSLHRFDLPFDGELRHRPGDQGVCYCPTGSMTEFKASFFGFTLCGWLSRDWTPKPCHCDKVIWLCFPEHYPEEIEEYGLDKLKAEYPGVGA